MLRHGRHPQLLFYAAVWLGVIALLTLAASFVMDAPTWREQENYPTLARSLARLALVASVIVIAAWRRRLRAVGIAIVAGSIVYGVISFAIELL